MALDEVQLACYWLLSVSFPLSSSTSVTHDFVSSPGDPLADVTSEFSPLISHHLLLDKLEGITAELYWLEFIGATTYWCNGSAMMSCESADPQATRAIETSRYFGPTKFYSRHPASRHLGNATRSVNVNKGHELFEPAV